MKLDIVERNLDIRAMEFVQLIPTPPAWPRPVSTECSDMVLSNLCRPYNINS